MIDAELDAIDAMVSRAEAKMGVRVKDSVVLAVIADLRAARAELTNLRAEPSHHGALRAVENAVWVAVQECAAADGLDGEGPLGYLTDGLAYWTPTFAGENLKRLVRALAALHSDDKEGTE